MSFAAEALLKLILVEEGGKPIYLYRSIALKVATFGSDECREMTS
jgi:hypothetical protein